MPADRDSEQRRRGPLAALFFAAGGLALTVQVVLLRELIVALQGDETAVGLGLAAWLGGVAVGAMVARRLARRRPERWAALGVGLLAVAGPVEVLVSRLGSRALAAAPGELAPLGASVLLAAAVLAPAGALVGLGFATLAATARRAGWSAGRGIARLYVLESAGSLAGGLGVTFVLAPYLPPLTGALAASAFWLALAWPAARGGTVPGRWGFAMAAVVLGALALPPLARPLEDFSVAARFNGLAPGLPLAAWVETPYQHMVLSDGEVQHLYRGGQYAGSFPDSAEHEALAHRLACLAPEPENVLLIGGGAEGLLRHLLAHPVRRVDFVEIDGRALRSLRTFLPAEDRAALDDPRVHVEVNDPRRFLMRAERHYDLILLLEPPPVTLLLARLSTVEFYRLCSTRLQDDGVVVVPLQTGPNILTGEDAALAGSLRSALAEVFPVVRAAPGLDGLLLAGRDADAATLDPDALATRWNDRGLRSDVFVPELFALLFPPERVAAHEQALRAEAARVPASRDARPVSFLHALALRQRIAGSAVAPLLGRVARADPRALAALAVLPSLAVLAVLGVRRRRSAPSALAAVHAVAVTGACGMAWSLLVLFSYQTRAGALYGRIGLLTALFMLGLAAGGFALSATAEMSGRGLRRRLLAVVALGLVFALVLPVLLAILSAPALAAAGLAELGHGVVLLAAGFVTGALFPVAAGVLLARRRDALTAAGRLETADHAGAAVAALAGGALFIPALGLTATAWTLAALMAVALLGVFLGGKAGD